MKRRLLLFLALVFMLVAFSLSSQSVLAGHAILGNGKTIQCECTPKDGSYVCLDDVTNEPLPPCGSFAAGERHGYRVK